MSILSCQWLINSAGWHKVSCVSKYSFSGNRKLTIYLFMLCASSLVTLSSSLIFCLVLSFFLSLPLFLSVFVPPPFSIRLLSYFYLFFLSLSLSFPLCISFLLLPDPSCFQLLYLALDCFHLFFLVFSWGFFVSLILLISSPFFIFLPLSASHI